MKRWKKWLSAGLLTVMIGAGIATGSVSDTYAQNMPYDRSDNVAPEELVPQVGASSSKKIDKNAWKKINGVCYNGSGKKIEGAITRGIDVSEWQGKIDWQAASKDIDFTFIRIAHSTTHLDYTYDYNITEAEAAGVPAGTYVYSTATTNAQALAEAQLAIRKMQGHKISYPVAFDLEDEPTMGKCSPTEISKMALTFCDEIKKAGYTPILYMNLNWYNNYIDWSVLEGSGLDVWIACYGDTILAPSTDKYRYTIWQCTAGDEVPGMNPTKKLISGVGDYNNVDLNFGFVDYTTRIAPRWNSLASYTPATKPLYADSRHGWVTSNGKKYYYANGEKVTGWRKISGKYYYFSETDGQLYKSRLVVSDGTAYYVDKKGVRVKDKLVTRKKKTYYLGTDGKALTGVRKINGKYYYFSPQTFAMQKNYKYVTPKKAIYYFDANGVRVKNQFVAIKENGKSHVYYFGRNGKAVKGWKTIRGKKYYFYGGKGSMAGVRAQRTTLTSSNGTVSVFNKYGVCTKQYKK